MLDVVLNILCLQILNERKLFLKFLYTFFEYICALTIKIKYVLERFRKLQHTCLTLWYDLTIQEAEHEPKGLFKARSNISGRDTWPHHSSEDPQEKKNLAWDSVLIIFPSSLLSVEPSGVQALKNPNPLKDVEG